jgi:hypothetical protein
VVLCGIFVSGGFNERSTIENATDPTQLGMLVRAVKAGSQVWTGFNAFSLYTITKIDVTTPCTISLVPVPLHMLY